MSDITVKELQLLQEETNRKLAIAIAPILNNFINISGIDIQGIDCHFVEITVHGDSRRKYRLSGIDTEISWEALK